MNQHLPPEQPVQQLQNLKECHPFFYKQFSIQNLKNGILDPSPMQRFTKQKIKEGKKLQKAKLRKLKAKAENHRKLLTKFIEDVNPKANTYYRQLTRNPRYSTVIVCDEENSDVPRFFDRNFVPNSTDNYLAAIALYLAANTVKQPTVLVLDGILDVDASKHYAIINLLQNSMRDQNIILLVSSKEHESLRSLNNIHIAFESDAVSSTITFFYFLYLDFIC